MATTSPRKALTPPPEGEVPSVPQEIPPPIGSKLFLTPYIYGDIVTVAVGKPETSFMKFNVHKNLLCHHSQFFEGALKPSFKEGQDGLVTLPEEETHVFSVFLHWLYTGNLPAPKHMPKSIGIDPASLYLRTFFLADRLLVDKLQGQCYAKIRKYLAPGTTLSEGLIDDLYDLAEEDFKLRTFVCESTAHLITSGEHQGEEWYTLLTTRDDFAADVARRMAYKCSDAYVNADPREDKQFDAWENKISRDISVAQNSANDNVSQQQDTS